MPKRRFAWACLLHGKALQLKAAASRRTPKEFSAICDFQNLLSVLRREPTERTVLFEFFMNDRLYEKLAGPLADFGSDGLARFRWVVRAFHKAGYDYATVPGSDMVFPFGEQRMEKSVSQNEGAVIAGRADFEAYDWPDPDALDYSRLDALAADLPGAMRLVVPGPGGVLENAVNLVGCEALCMMILEDPELARDVFDAVGSRLVRYYEICASYGSVGALISNDDWGFHSQTLFSPEEMRRFVFPWHERIVGAIHAAGKPAILHSCGNLTAVMDDVIDGLRYDAKHSFEDSIEPVEEAYERYGGRIALLGGMDVDFLCRAGLDEIRSRSRAMVRRAAARGAWALGSGNSIPDYVPDERYFAMISAAKERID